MLRQVGFTPELTGCLCGSEQRKLAFPLTWRRSQIFTVWSTEAVASNQSQLGFRATWVTFFLCIRRFQSCRGEPGSAGDRELRWGEGSEGAPRAQSTHLFTVHVQQKHVPHVVSCDHHSASGRHVQAAKPHAGRRDCTVRFLGPERGPLTHCCSSWA